MKAQVYENFEVVVETAPECPACDGLPVDLGILGNLQWLRCRQCGLQYHVTVSNAPTFRDCDE
jgi:transcription elongation factor Elf1